MWTEFLQRLSSADPEFTYDDISEWSGNDFEALTEAGLLHEIERATEVSCNACPEAHWERVRLSEDGKRAFISCPLAGTIDVDANRLRRWRASPSQLSNLLAQALALSGQVRLLPGTRIWSLGRRGVAGRTPYFFFAAVEPDELPSAVEGVRQAYGRVTGALLLPFSSPSSVDTDKLRTVNLEIISTFQSGRIAVDSGLIEDQFTDGRLGSKPGPRAKGAAHSLASHRRAILKAFMKEKEIDGMEALARSVGVSETALHGMVRGDTKRYSDDKLASVLKQIGCPRTKWGRTAKLATRA